MRERLLAIGGDLTMAALSEIRGRPSATEPWIRGWPSCAVTVTGLAFSPTPGSAYRRRRRPSSARPSARAAPWSGARSAADRSPA